MAVSLLLDENLEHEVRHRLRDRNVDVDHVDVHAELEKGADDERLAQFSLHNEVLLVTYDDDFETHHDESEYWGVLLLTDNQWSALEVADAIHRIVRLYPASELRGMNVVGREWL